MVDHGLVQMIGVHRPELVPVFSGLSVPQFTKLVSCEDVGQHRSAPDAGGDCPCMIECCWSRSTTAPT